MEKEIPIWISEYVLAGYGTGAIMAVPCGDERDHKFAQYFNIPITNIIGEAYNGQGSQSYKRSHFGKLRIYQRNDDERCYWSGDKWIGSQRYRGEENHHKMRDAAFSRQRYWGEPAQLVWKDGIAYSLDESVLPSNCHR